jgi:hypothetical protein
MRQARFLALTVVTIVPGRRRGSVNDPDQAPDPGVMRAMSQAEFVGLLALMLAVPPALFWLALLAERQRRFKRVALSL